MSFGQIDARLSTHIQDLHSQRSRDQVERTRPAPRRRVTFSSRAVHLQDRLGVRLVEVGLHLMVRARRSAPRPRYQSGGLRPSSGAHGR